PLIPFFWAPGWNSDNAINKYQIEVGGPLHSGDPGLRLIEPVGNETLKYYFDIPNKFEILKGEWMIVPLYLIFGSEELSSQSASIQKRIPKPYLVLNSQDAQKLKIEGGSTVQITIGSVPYSLKVKISKDFPRGAAGFTVGLPGQSFTELPARGKISGRAQ
ncbi:MAG: NADH-quinone oxidoreductase subunit G, partial [Calditrichaeota bacterium]|nr:NADH-quinone oxidoreductase subunit G [Calditrichota bacterium]